MPKYYVKCGTLELVVSTEQYPFEVAGRCLWESNKDDVLDEHFYIDEQGYRDAFSATPKTIVLTLKEVCKAEGWTLSNDQNTSRKPFVRKDLGQTRPAGLDASPYWATTYVTYCKYHAKPISQKIILVWHEINSQKFLNLSLDFSR